MNDKLIQIGGKPYKQCEVVMLPNRGENFRNSKILTRLDKMIFADKKEIDVSKYLGKYGYNGYHLYILSDEEIKEGDWYFDGTDLVHKKTKYNDALVDGNKDAKKIILTTDQNLIKDGVQAIDDEFLKWFVKNPSCNYIKTEPIYYAPGYNFDIPKEESKQEIPQLGTKEFNDLASAYFGGKPKQQYEYVKSKDVVLGYKTSTVAQTLDKLVIKQETLEEVAERLSKDAYKKHSVKDYELSLDEQIQRSGGFIVGFKEGFRAHQELTKDKLFTIEDINKAMDCVYNWMIEGSGNLYGRFPRASSLEELKSNFKEDYLQPKTEWDIKFNEKGKLKKYLKNFLTIGAKDIKLILKKID